MSEPNYSPSDRRPISSRNTRWAEGVTKLLVRLGALPNAISMFGMFAAMAAGVAFYFTDLADSPANRVLWMCGGILCQVRLLCNLFDGMVAVQREIASRLGELYNEVPDRISDSAVFIGLGYAAGGEIVLGYLAALVSVFVAYVRATGKSIGAANDFCGPMAKPQRMALATVLAAYMALSPQSWRLAWGEAKIVLVIVIVGGIATAIRRLKRAANQLDRPSA